MKLTTRIALLGALLLAPAAALAQIQTPVYCNASTSTACNTASNPWNGTQGDPAWLAFGKVNSWGTQLGLFANDPANEVLATPNGSTGIPGLRALVPADLPATVAELNVANDWTALQTFLNSDIDLLGSSSGYTTLTSANGGATNYVLTIPANTGTVAELNLGQSWTALQNFGTDIEIGGVQPTGATGSGAIVFGTSPTLTTPDLGTPSAIDLTNATFPASISAITTLPNLTSVNGSTIPATAGTLAGSTGTFTLSDCLEVGSTSPLEIEDAGAGCGSVTSVSIVSANGLSGTVATATTTPAITLAPNFTGIAYSSGTAFAAAVAADFPILNQSTTGNAATATTATEWGGQALPSLVSGDFLTNNGTSLSWAPGGSAFSSLTSGTNQGISAPSGLAATVNTATSTLPASTEYAFEVVGVTANGTTTPSSVVTATTGTTANDSTISLTWTADTGASSYEIWYAAGSTVPSSANYYTSTTASYTFSAASGTSGTVPSANTTGNAMLVGIGSSLAPTGSGTLSANAVNGAAVPASAQCLSSNSSSQLVSGCPEPIGNGGAQITSLPYTVATTDCGSQLVINDSSAGALDIPQATGGFATCQFDVTNIGAGTATLTPATSTINGATTLAVAQNRQCTVNSDGTNWQVIGCTALISGSASNVQIFTASGTWTKPATGNTTEAECIGGGGGGGSGDVEPSGTAANGGPGGGGAPLAAETFQTSTLPSTVAVTIATGGTGGAALTAAGTGNDGVAGGNSTFGTYLTAFGGGAGQPVTNYGGGSGGLVSASTTHYGGLVCGSDGAGGGTAPSPPCINGGSGGGGSNGSGGAGNAGGAAGYGGSGAGAGGGIPTGGTFSAGAPSGSIPLVAGAAAGTTDGAAGAAGSCGSAIGGCTGGGGGASSVSGTGGNGGAGGIGAGGGGGGASETQSGAGGAGGGGECWIITW